MAAMDDRGGAVAGDEGGGTGTGDLSRPPKPSWLSSPKAGGRLGATKMSCMPYSLRHARYRGQGAGGGGTGGEGMA